MWFTSSPGRFFITSSPGVFLLLPAHGMFHYFYPPGYLNTTYFQSSGVLVSPTTTSFQPFRLFNTLTSSVGDCIVVTTTHLSHLPPSTVLDDCWLWWCSVLDGCWLFCGCICVSPLGPIDCPEALLLKQQVCHRL